MKANPNKLRRTFLRKAKKVTWRSEARVLQWLWFVLRVKPERIGYGKGPLTWLRQREHKKLRRGIHICLLEYNPKGKKVKFGEFTVFWINERSRICTASLNERIEDADIVWVYSQDPLPPDIKNRLLQKLKETKVETPIINHPNVYNSYHEEHAFKVLAEAGVSVPRTEFTNEDIDKTLVVYKAKGQGNTPKFLSKYAGPKAGYRTFEFIDTRGSDGLYRRYRAFYIAGTVRQSTAMVSDYWNVHAGKMKGHEFRFTVTPFEIAQIRLIAKTFGVQHFAVDYLRRKRNGLPVFLDINVYPTPCSLVLANVGRRLGYYGSWHVFDVHKLLGIPEPLGRPAWEIFDEAMLSFSSKGGLPLQ